MLVNISSIYTSHSNFNVDTSQQHFIWLRLCVHDVDSVDNLLNNTPFWSIMAVLGNQWVTVQE
jgi:hypothetical protein